MGNRVRLAVCTALLAACEHGAPFRPGDYTPDGPLAGGGSLVRLTYNPGVDATPILRPDGTVLYSAERLDRADRDRCLAELPGAGGTVRYACRTSAPDDSVDVFEDAVPAPPGDDRVAYVRVSSHRLPFRPVSPDAQALVVTTAGARDINDVRVLRTIAYTAPAPSGRIHQGVSHIGWLGTTRLVYLGEAVAYPRGCPSCTPDTVRTGIEIVTLDFAAPDPVLVVVPGTSGASSVTVGATGDTIYFTLNGDSRVYRHAFSSGQTDTVYDFGGAGIARGLAYRAGRLVAVVGGNVAYSPDTVLGVTQRDRGGDLQLLDLASGVATPVARAVGGLQVWFRRPTFSSDGGAVVAQGQGFEIDSTFVPPGGLRIDTLYFAGPDLWRRSVP